MRSSQELSNIYVSVEDVAKVKNVTVRAVRKSCKLNKYIARYVKTQSGGGNSGRQYEILLSSIEPEIQEKILKNLNAANKVADSSPGSINTYPQEPPCAPVSFLCSMTTNQTTVAEPCPPFLLEEKVIPERAKKLALAKVDLIRHWQNYRQGQKNKAQADKEFMSGYNSKMYPNIYALAGKISVQSLYRWNKELKDANNDYRALISNYNYGCESHIRTSLSEKEIKLLNDLLLHPAKLSVGNAYRLIKFCLEQTGIAQIASYPAYKRYVNKLKRNKNDVWVLMREGQKKLLDSVVPYIQRDISRLEVGDVLIADGHTLDFMIRNPLTGRPCRATIVVYQDWKSADIAGYEIMLTENTQCIASALRNAIIRLGKIPKIAYQDNGRAFRAKFFRGCESLEQSGFYGLFGSLGVIPVFATPYNSKAKSVERFFLEFTQTYSSLLVSYVGNCIENRPAYLKRNEKFHKSIHSEHIPTIDEITKSLEQWFIFYRSQPCPNVEGKTIGEVFDEGKGSGIDINTLDELMMAQEIRQVGRNEVRMCANMYDSDELYGMKDKVVVKYSLLDIFNGKIYGKSGEFICDAHALKEIHPMAELMGDSNDKYAYKEALKAQKRKVKKTMDEARKLVPRLEKALDWQKIEKIKAIQTMKDKEEENKYKITCYDNVESLPLIDNTQYRLYQ